MQDAFSRMELLVGNTGVKKLSRAKIAVFGLGGAGSQVAESLARCGVGPYNRYKFRKSGNWFLLTPAPDALWMQDDTG